MRRVPGPAGRTSPSRGLFDKTGSFVGLSLGADHLRLGSRQAPGKMAKVMDFVLNSFSLWVPSGLANPLFLLSGS